MKIFFKMGTDIYILYIRSTYWPNFVVLCVQKDGHMYIFLFGKLSQYPALEIHTGRQLEEKREEFKLHFPGLS